MRSTLRRLRVMKSSSLPRLLKAHILVLAGRIEQHQHGGQHGDGKQERHDHADAGDLPQLGDAGIGGGQEGKEAGGGGGGGQRQGNAHAAPGGGQRLHQIVIAMALAAIAHRELDAEIHPQADEQRDEGDGDDVEHAHRLQAQPHGDGQAHEQA